MNSSALPHLLAFYGFFLCACGIISVIFIGRKAKTALVSGGVSGITALYIAWLMSNGNTMAAGAGIGLSLVLFIVFAWRATKTLLKIFELIPIQSTELPGKGIAFLIISLMAVVSMMVLVIQVMLVDLN